MSLVTPGGAGDTAWLVDISDSLVISGASSQTGEKLTCNFRFAQVDASGCFAKIWADSRVLDLSAGDRSVKSITYTFDQQFFSGPNSQTYLSDISIESAVATTRGQSFARVNLFRKSNNAKSTKCAILSDYVTMQVTACLRNARHFTSTEGPGWSYAITVSNPGVGNDWSLTVPSNARWAIHGILALFTADATAGQRFSLLQILTNTAIAGSQLVAADSLVFAPSSTNYVNAAPSNPYAASGAASQSYYSPIPRGILLAGSKIKTITTAFVGPADVWTNIGIEVEEWIDNV